MSSESTNLIPVVIAVLVPLSVAVIAGSFAYWRYLRERAHTQENTMNALFGEIGSLLEHYAYAHGELPEASDRPDFVERLRWSQYDEVAAASDIHRFGFLTAEEIQLLLQLGLRIRNNDIYCRMLLDRYADDPASVTEANLEYLRSRFQYTAKTANELLQLFTEKQPKLARRLERITEDVRSQLEDRD